ncbi:enoyl-CoA hydratase [Actinomadura sp. LD22]|uniref:Enoyl-CoA hydratase n=1 Tax=Actinomadura physcomitrii TaxID=2650748 RepID=A0A6I4M9T7_9ACTN|nr:enoyl-CoA hydratase [Actinomadura physcomitrii]MWA00837.1 enoyl-CoA hydratase [Actinomadura physcomitrii]
MSDGPVILAADTGAVRILTLNRPGARNALSSELNNALYRALEEADGDDAVKAVVVTGADPAFCAGLDLKEAGAEGAAFFERFRGANCIVRIGEMRKPVVGAVNGAAFTGGLEIALGCDFLVASERAVFADTHVRVGVLPGGGLTARLPRVVGAANARRMSMTGEVVDAACAERIGLVSEVVPHGELLARALALASSVAEVPAEAMQDLKRMYSENRGLVDDLAAEVAIAGAYRADFDGIEGRRAQVQSRNRAQISQEER